jgi:type IV pilus assembly protein PilC
MLKFSYLAKSQSGSTVQGFITAPNEDIAITDLQSKGLIIISLKNTSQQSFFKQDLELFNKVSDKELVIFSRVLATFLEVNVPLIEAIVVLREQNKKNKYFAAVLDQIIADMQDGGLFSESIAKHPKVFKSLYVAMINSGEVTGALQRALSYLADYLEEQYDLNNKVKGALLYPTVVLSIFVIIGLGIAYYVLPQLVTVLEGLGSDAKLPITTQIIIWMSNIIQQYILLILVGIIAIGGWIWYYLGTAVGKRWSDKWKLRLPIFGSLFTKMYVTQFSTNMSTLIEGGIPIIRCLEISSDIVNNFVFTGIIQEAVNEIKAGSEMTKAFARHPEFPLIATQIMMVGEKTGKTQSVLKTLAGFYKKEVDVVVDNLTVLIEPVMIVVLGIGVAIFVVSIMLPIYNIAGTL